LVTRAGGTIILAAACPEGSGSATYEQWMKGKTSFQEVMASFQQEGFRVGPHKAFQIARDAASVRLLWLSEMPDAFVRQMLLTPVGSLEAALARAFAGLPVEARIGIMPLANATIPIVQK
jgi:nickel-dependent lactate racemase